MPMTTLMELSDRYLAAREQCEAFEETAKAARARRDEAEQKLIDAMTLSEDGITSFKRQDGVSLSIIRKSHYNVPAANKEALYSIVRARKGLEYLFTINPKTLNKALNEMVENCGELPPDIESLVANYEEITLSVRGHSRRGD